MENTENLESDYDLNNKLYGNLISNALWFLEHKDSFV
jgi:flagellar biosynthesis regulator FlaF